ncbi:nudix hydrolase 16, mitochondrial isoform X1 [Cryptomeria japonica]|uniref:nudix hydrolase 16, mitochondrial isoform X1 n=2 Tax=Cryptomeria japonica TaxID=3369 RepID=UPI0025AD6533|nr:nudix hydrolase 16, mitochondrial isoform X1 [Cryptomeria japonica]XP_057853157.1 nudix hydrolase 16, mitochondrial isoform X1 [Cryptomeria japonica]
MVASVSPTGRCRQRYVDGCRLVAGCIPYRYNNSCDTCNGDSQGRLEVLMVTPHRGEGFLFPKGGWETNETQEAAACREALEEAGVSGVIMNCLGSWEFTSKSCQDEHGLQRKVYMYLLHVTEELDSWPEDAVRERKWVPVTEAMGLCKNEWMREALVKFTDCLEGGDTLCSSPVSGDDSASDSLSHVSDEQPSEQPACEETVPAPAGILSDNAASDDEAPSCTTEENTSSSSD